MRQDAFEALDGAETAVTPTTFTGTADLTLRCDPLTFRDGWDDPGFWRAAMGTTDFERAHDCSGMAGWGVSGERRARTSTQSG